MVILCIRDSLHLITATEDGKTYSKCGTDQQKLRALSRYYKRFDKVCHMCPISRNMFIVVKTDQ